MVNADAVAQHPLSLKVMRVSRPSLAAHWQPFFSSSPSFSAHATANVLSIQGSEPLPGHPKTLRDLTHAGTLLTLPTQFGAIYLGETFSCVLCVNNETGTPVDGASVRVEMQTVTTKVMLAEVAGTGAGQSIDAGDSFGVTVNHEIQELGQHVLACVVSYRIPSGIRPPSGATENAGSPSIQTFRKFYKFQISNPLSVKTKVHVPRSISAQLSCSEREKVFLEVYIHNLTQNSLWFEKVRLEPVSGWNVTDANYLQKGEPLESIFSGDTALMAPQDVRQYIYILTPKVLTKSTAVHITHAPGSIIPLGRLDISWRSGMGEPGRLLTSVLSRRIPLAPISPPNLPPISAVPAHLQRSVSLGVPRSATPQQQIQRVVTPPPRSASPSLRIAASVPPPPPPKSPNQSGTLIAPSQRVQTQIDILLDLVLVESPPKATVIVDKPFSLRFMLAVSAALPRPVANLLSDPSQNRRLRSLRLAIQHVLPSQTRHVSDSYSNSAVIAPRTLKKRTSTLLSFDTISTTPGVRTPPSRAGSMDVLTPHRVMSPPPASAGGAYPTPGVDSLSVARGPSMTLAPGGLTERLQKVALSEALGIEESHKPEAFGDSENDRIIVQDSVRFPSPYSMTAGHSLDTSATTHVSYIGTSVMLLPPILLSPSDSETPTEVTVVGGATPSERGEGHVEFDLHYIARSMGFAKFGGLRVLLMEDREEDIVPPSSKLDGGKKDEGDEQTLRPTSSRVEPLEARILREWDAVAEVWVR